MKLSLIAALLILFCGCKSGQQDTSVQKQEPVQEEVKENTNFFPVTSFILGQISEIKTKGINPIKLNGKDTVWLKIEELEKEMDEFLHPVIDTANMKSYFTETKFLDQTVDAYTFIYEPKAELPDSINVERWMVYVDPQKNSVRRIFIQKNANGKKGYLTWEAGKSCKMSFVSADASGNPKVEKETLINWDY